METHPEFGILSPWQNYPDNKTEYWFGVWYDNRTVQNSDSYQNCMIEMYSPAAHWMLNRRCLEKTGGFSPSFTHYGEDENYMQRVIWHGMKVGVCRDAKAVHDTGVRKQTLEQAFYRQYVSRVVTYNNPFDKSSKVAVTWEYLIFVLRNCKQYRTLSPLKYFGRFLHSRSQFNVNLRKSKEETCAFL